MRSDESTTQAPPAGVRTAPASPPRVLVLLALFNGSSYLKEQLESLAAQRDVAVRVLASDDGSTDGTPAMVLRESERLGLSCRLLPEHPPSGSSANNFYTLLAAADFGECDYVALCDQDDVWMPRKLSEAVARLRKSDASGYSCNSIAFWPDRSRRIRKDYQQKRLDYLFESASHGCTYVLTAAAAFRFTAFMRPRRDPLSRIAYHDWVIYAWARSRGLTWVMDDQHLIAYRQTGANVIGANAGLRPALQRLGALRSGWLRREAIAIAHVIGEQGLPVVARLERFGIVDRCWLAFHARSFRRRPRDVAVFALACLTIGI